VAARFVVVLVVVLCGCGVWVSGASAVSKVARWGLRSFAYPYDFSAGDNAACEAEDSLSAHFICDTYVVSATNVGGWETGGGSVTLKDVLPAGLVVRNVSLFLGIEGKLGEDVGPQFCTVSPVQCVLSRSLKPEESIKMYVSVLVKVPVTAGMLTNSVSVSGGGVAGVSATGSNTLEEGSPGFGPVLLEAPFVGVDGLPVVRAGGHPNELYTTIGLGSVIREAPETPVRATSVEDVRDVFVDLPVGVAGSGVSAARCTLARLSSKGAPEKEGGSRGGKSGCPGNTIIGHLQTVPEADAAVYSPIYNLLPEKGHAAELGFFDLTGGSHVLYVSLAPSPAGYVLRTSSREVPQVTLREVLANVYGNPGVRDKSGEATPPTFTSPSDCTGEPLVSRVLMDSWQHPGRYNPDGTPDLSDPNWKSSSYASPPVTGCEQLAGLFEPSITATPSDTRAGSPTGLEVDVAVPQKTGPEGQDTPPLRDTTVTLPEGMVVDPSSANGLQACSLEQVGISSTGVPDAAPPRCPDASKIGTVELETPALAMEACKKPATPLQECPNEGEREATPLTGSIYVAKQGENPFGSLLAIYIVIDDPRTGVVVKIPAKVTPDPVTGRLTTTVTDTPQFPFSILRTKFFDGDAAPLNNPPECGVNTVTSELTPWSAPDSGPAATPSASFQTTQNPDGGPCAPLSFSPTLQAGTDSTTAKAYSPLTVSFSRTDSEQQLAGASISTPLGLLGTLKGIPRCPDALANSGDCPAASLIGEATTAVGAGPHPYWVHGGKVYLTGPHGDGPFGLSIVVPTTAGPYTLTGNAGPGREVVRAAIVIDPHTDQITVRSDPFPTILEGIPLQIRTVRVNVNRPNFTFNPTNCSQLTSTATFTSTRNQTSTTSTPYYASGCAGLPFNPTLTAATSAHTSKPNGTSLTITVTSHPGEANVAKTDLQIPSQLPARINTLHHACLAKVFETNPANCPTESTIGTATVTTPLLENPLTGPIYLVSYGSEGFPRTEIVLQGEGITTILQGNTDIKHSITYSNFETVPDVPFTTFTATLPAGPHSIFGAYLPNTNGNPCGLHLTLPTHLQAQNNKQQNRKTPITITGCPTHPTIENITQHTKHHHTTITLTLYTPTTTLLKITGKGIHPLTTHTTQNNLQTITLHTTQHHPHKTTLTLTQTTNHKHQTTHTKITL